MRPSLTPSLSRGLARDAYALLDRQGAKFHNKVARVLRGGAATKKALLQRVDELRRLGEAAELIQVIGLTPNGRDALTSHFVPEIGLSVEGRRSKVLRFCLVQIALSTRRDVAVGSDFGVVLDVDEHAIERLFLRLNTLSLAAVADELRDAMLLTLPLIEVAQRLHLRQLALPTSTGAFLCHYDASKHRLSAMTWLSTGQAGARWGALCDILREAHGATGGEHELAVQLGSGMKQCIAEGNCRVVEYLALALSSIAWLKNSYAPGPDLVGEWWASARRQSSELSAAALA